MKTTQVQAIITSISSRVDRSLRVSFVTPELTTSERAIFMELQNINSEFTIKPLESKNAEVVKIEKDFGSKPQSVRLRNVLYILFTQNPERHADFTEYYRSKMEGIIEHLKTKIQE